MKVFGTAPRLEISHGSDNHKNQAQTNDSANISSVTTATNPDT